MGIASDFVLIVIAGLIGGLAARALRLPLLVGYVAAGVLVGPHTAGPTVVQVHDIELLAEIGVALLLFSLGLELSFRDLQPVQRVALIGGPIQIVATCALGAVGASKLLDVPFPDAIWFGGMVSVSSTAVVLKMLSAAGVTSTLASRVMIGLLVLQDLAVVPMLVILPQLGDISNLLGNLAKAVAIAVVLLAAIVLLGTRLLPKLLRLVLGWKSRELFLVSVVAIGVGVGYATQRVGLSFALGAFVAGLVLSESEYSHQALSDVVPIRDVFGLLFFVSVGMLLDPAYVLSHAGQIAAVVLLTFLSKSVIIGGLARAFGYVNMAPWIIGLGLAQIGEFSFVLARTGLTSGSLSKPTYDLALTCTVVTMALSPLAYNLAMPLGRAWRNWRKPSPANQEAVHFEKSDLQGHIIVAGYGRTGRAAARVLQQASVPFIVVELNHAVYRELGGDGIAGVWGDATGEHIMRAANIERARILLLTMPHSGTIRLIVERARMLSPAIAVIARAVRMDQAGELGRLGIAAVVQPELEGGIEMVRRALILCGSDSEQALRLADHARAELYGSSVAV
ncbi:MAG TPA: cation:proton antiporter [Candidatus Solibacter sp.]|nr:cation:proton antiporter [Candidatus Solibacter sp.]